MESNDNHMNKELSSEEAAKIWSEAENQIIEERSHDANFMKIKDDWKISILKEELRDILPETIKKSQYYDLKILYRKARDINEHLSNVCPKCSYVNQGPVNYCVNCGKLLPGKESKIVIDSSEYSRLKKRPSEYEYKTLKERANISIGKHLLSVISGFWNRHDELLFPFMAISVSLFASLFIGFVLSYSFNGCSSKEPSLVVIKGDDGYGLQWNDDSLLVLACKYDSIKEVRISSNSQPYRLFYKDSLMGIVSPKGEVLSQCEYKDIDLNSHIFMIRHQDGYWDLMKPNGKIITDGHYDRIRWQYEEGKFAAVIGYIYKSSSPLAKDKTTPLFSIVDGDGNFLLKDCFWIYGYSQGLSAVQRTNKDELEYVDMTGKKVLPTEYVVVNTPISYEKYSFWKHENGNDIDPSFKNDTARIYVNGVKSYLFRDGKYSPVEDKNK